MKPIHLLLTAVSVAAALLFSGCNKLPTESESIASAQRYIDKRDYKAAGIELRNALQSNPDSGRARFLLGRTLYEMGEPGLATGELRKALELRHPEVDVLPILARCMLRQGQYKRVIEDFSSKSLSDVDANADLQTSVATALNGLGKRSEAEAVLGKALQSAPKFSAARIFQARMRADAQDVAGALESLTGVTKDDPKNAEAWRVRGDLLLYGKGDLDQALASYLHALEVQPEDLTALTAATSVQLMRHDIDAAEVQFRRMQKLFPGNPQVRYFEAQFSFARNDHQAAREQLLQLSKLMPNNLRLLQLAGANELALNSLVQAEAYLSKAVQLNPEAYGARILLARAHLRLGQPDKAISTLAPLLEQPEPGARVLSMVAEAYLNSGDAQRAEEMYHRAAKTKPDDAKLQTGRARALLAKGQTDAALAELGRIASADQGTDADMVLISALLRRKDLAGALRAVDRLESKQPKSASVANLRGDIQLRQGDKVGARASFERAFREDPAYFPAIAGLAALDQADNNAKGAIARLEAVLQKTPKHVPALLALARARAVNGAPADEVTKILLDAVAADSADVRARLALIDHYLANGDAKSALSAARDADAVISGQPEILDVLGRALLAAGEPQQAISTYNKWIGQQPNSIVPHLRLADLHASRRDWEAALTSFRRAQQINPDAPAAALGIVRVEVINKRYDKALAVIKTLQAKRPNEATGYAVEGDIEAARKHWDAAIAAYRIAVSKPDAATEIASRLHAALLVAGKPEQADAMAADWVKAHPSDSAFLFNLGQIALSLGNLPAAERRFNEVLKMDPNHPASLNNIAWIMVQQNRPGAVAIAERAVRAMPNTPQLLDTLAGALAAEGQLAKAIEVQKSAVEKAGVTGAGYTLGLARLYIKDGRSSLAQAELTKLAALGDKFADQPEVNRLMKSLQK